MAEIAPPKSKTVVGCNCPAGKGRVAVRCIRASHSRSRYWFNAAAPAATNAVASTVLIISAYFTGPIAPM